MKKQHLDSVELSSILFDFCSRNPYKLKPKHISVYISLAHIRDRMGLKHEFTPSSDLVIKISGVKSHLNYLRVLEDLSDYGFIRYSLNKNGEHIIEFLEIN